MLYINIILIGGFMFNMFTFERLSWFWLTIVAVEDGTGTNLPVNIVNAK